MDKLNLFNKNDIQGIKMSAQILDLDILKESFSLKFQHEGFIESVSKVRYDLTDKALRSALIALGWTPPSEGKS